MAAGWWGGSAAARACCFKQNRKTSTASLAWFRPTQHQTARVRKTINRTADDQGRTRPVACEDSPRAGGSGPSEKGQAERAEIPPPCWPGERRPQTHAPACKVQLGPLARALPQGSLGFPRGSAAACSALRPSCPSTSGLTRPAGHAHSGQSAPRPRSRPAHGRPHRERHCVPSGEVCSSRPTLGAGGLTLHVCTHRPTEPEHARPCEPRVCSSEQHPTVLARVRSPLFPHHQQGN